LLVIGKPPPNNKKPDCAKDIAALPADTWRCVSCHGWDYNGKDGHLGKSRKSLVLASLRLIGFNKLEDDSRFRSIRSKPIVF